MGYILIDCGFIDKRGQAPILYYKKKENNIVTRIYYSKLIPLQKYKEKELQPSEGLPAP